MGIIESKIEEKLAALGAVFTDEGQRTRLALAAALAETVRGNRIDGAAPRTLRAGIVYPGAGRLVGWSVRETGGTAGVGVDLYDGLTADAAGDPSRLVASFALAAGGCSVHNAMPAGVSFTEGLWAVYTGTGTPFGALWRGAVD